MKILVDADGCPVKDIIIDVARRYNTGVVLVKSICHELYDDYAEIITVDKGKDVADIALINNTKAGDIVVTQDYGVAAMAIAKKAFAINQNGWSYTDDNMDNLLMKRYIGQEMRRKYKKYTKIPKRTKEDDIEFEKLLVSYLENR
ncbi:MAG TPA: YaiI/YqxD family protein [Oscillospiraceae bacterium]|nr:YaiI/YqxD family protein [Oscillospiraceae bacterium]